MAGNQRSIPRWAGEQPWGVKLRTRPLSMVGLLLSCFFVGPFNGVFLFCSPFFHMCSTPQRGATPSFFDRWPLRPKEGGTTTRCPAEANRALPEGGKPVRSVPYHSVLLMQASFLHPSVERLLSRLPPAAADPRRIEGKVTRTCPETRPQTQGPLIRPSTATKKD